MNNFIDIDEIRGRNIFHYEHSNRFRAYCCGCISSESNLTFVCFLWAAISFYFAVLAFLQKSPNRVAFYSYIGTVPLVAFGAINLLFGIVTLTCMVLYISWTHKIRIAPIENMYAMNGTKKIVFAITANALAVLIVTLVNFILFIKGKNEFTGWCIEQSKNTIEKIYTADHKNTTSFPVDRLSGSTDIYNCERLFQDEVKWGLICLIVMFVVYIHWILIIAAREALDFYRQRGLMPAMTEFSNIAPSKTSKNYNVLHSIKPSTNILQDLLTHKQYGQFIPEEQLIHDRSPNITISAEPEKLVDEHVNSTVIHFEDNIYNSKEIQSPCNALHK